METNLQLAQESLLAGAFYQRTPYSFFGKTMEELNVDARTYLLTIKEVIPRKQLLQHPDRAKWYRFMLVHNFFRRLRTIDLKIMSLYDLALQQAQGIDLNTSAISAARPSSNDNNENDENTSDTGSLSDESSDHDSSGDYKMNEDGSTINETQMIDSNNANVSNDVEEDDRPAAEQLAEVICMRPLLVALFTEQFDSLIWLETNGQRGWSQAQKVLQYRDQMLEPVLTTVDTALARMQNVTDGVFVQNSELKLDQLTYHELATSATAFFPKAPRDMPDPNLCIWEMGIDFLGATNPQRADQHSENE